MSRASQIAWVLFKTAIFTICVPFVVGIWIPSRIYSGMQQAPDVFEFISPSRWFLSGFLFISGTLIYLWCAWDFSVKGMGTPAPIDAPKKLVVNGLYRFVRNPMYLGVSLLILAQALLYQSLAIFYYWSLFFVAASLFVLLYEEPHLKKVFGKEYNDYCQNVRRWIPRLSPYHPPTT